MKIYPHPKSNIRLDGGFMAEEIQRGDHWLRTDVECTECGKVQPLAMAGSTDRGRCIACGGRTS